MMGSGMGSTVCSNGAFVGGLFAWFSSRLPIFDRGLWKLYDHSRDNVSSCRAKATRSHGCHVLLGVPAGAKDKLKAVQDNRRAPVVSPDSNACIIEAASICALSVALGIEVLLHSCVGFQSTSDLHSVSVSPLRHRQQLLLLPPSNK
jgi:hypothetical protein